MLPNLMRPHEFQRYNRHLFRTMSALRYHLDRRHENGLVECGAVVIGDGPTPRSRAIPGVVSWKVARAAGEGGRLMTFTADNPADRAEMLYQLALVYGLAAVDNLLDDPPLRPGACGSAKFLADGSADDSTPSDLVGNGWPYERRRGAARPARASPADRSRPVAGILPSA